MTRASDVLDTPEIRRRTQRVLALQEKERDAESNLAYVVADIGDELRAVKAALAGNKSAWTTWLTDHVDFDIKTAENYMKVGGLRAKSKTFSIFARVQPSALYKIAALPDNLLQKLAADPRLPSPKTGALTRLDQMSARDLILALEILRGRQKQPKLPQGSRNALARAAIDAGRTYLDELEQVNAGTGKLDPANKRQMLDFIEELRAAVLHWKAWVTPTKGKRLVP